MSQSPIDPLAVYSPDLNPRPKSVTALAVGGIIWGILLLLCNGAGFALLFKPDLFGTNPATEAVARNTFARAWNTMSPVIGLALTFLLIAGSVGALRLRPWARTALIAFAVLQILLSLIGLVVTVAIVIPITGKAMAAELAKTPGASEITQVVQSVIALLIVLIGVSMPTWILIVMIRPNVKDAFAGFGASAVAAAVPQPSPAPHGLPSQP